MRLPQLYLAAQFPTWRNADYEVNTVAAEIATTLTMHHKGHITGV